MRLRPSTQRNSQSASSSEEVRPLGPHAPTFLALVVQERRSVVPHVEAHPPHRYVAFRARCRWPQPDSLPNRPDIRVGRRSTIATHVATITRRPQVTAATSTEEGRRRET